MIQEEITMVSKTMLAAVLLCAMGSATAKNIALPDNVTLRPGNMSGDYIDAVTLSVPGASFSKLKLCLAQNVSNPAVSVTGGTDAPLAFRSNQQTQTTTVQGGGIFKYEDAAAHTAIVMGSVDGGPAMMSREIIRFELTAIAGDEGTSLKFNNIARATENTGVVSNAGFQPVGAWRGAKPLAVIDALSALGGRVGSCLR